MFEDGILEFGNCGCFWNGMGIRPGNGNEKRKSIRKTPEESRTRFAQDLCRRFFAPANYDTRKLKIRRHYCPRRFCKMPIQGNSDTGKRLRIRRPLAWRRAVSQTRRLCSGRRAQILGSTTRKRAVLGQDWVQADSRVVVPSTKPCPSLSNIDPAYPREYSS